MWPCLVIALALLAAGCTIGRQSEPQRTATEEMQISTAADWAVSADRAISAINLTALRGKQVFVDAAHYEGLDHEYTMAALHEALLKNGAMLVFDAKSADAVVEMRNGSQSMDDRKFLIGVPSFGLPTQLAHTPFQNPAAGELGKTGTPQFPELALYAKAQTIGVSKLTIATYNPKTGSYDVSLGTVYGLAHDRHYTVLLFIGWRNNDFRPEEDNVTSK